MERDYIQVCLLRYVSHFNSHAHVERDQGATLCRQTHHHFNSHAHVERDFESSEPIKNPVDFNSHAHVERDPIAFENLVYSWDFNSHAHVERDWTSCLNSLPIPISTHTLTWSVTIFRKLCSLFIGISTHTLTWSVTKQVADDLKEYSDFNSHAHVERDATILIL